MQYMLNIYEDERLYEADPAKVEARRDGHMQLVRELGATRVGGAGLKSSSLATTVRESAGKRTVHDGPFAEAREQLAGYYLIEVPDMDAAVVWAKKVPLGENGFVEVRAVLGGGARAASAA